MFNSVLKRMTSALIIMVMLMPQITAAAADGTGSKVRYGNAAQYASTGKTNCYPDMGKWLNSETFYIEPSDKGDEIKPVNKDSDFEYWWLMPLFDVKDQIKDGLRYDIALDIFGHVFDFDMAAVYVDFMVPIDGGGAAREFVTDQYLLEDIDLWKHRSFMGYIPEGATYMRLRLASKKETGFLADKDAAIFYRNIEVFITDEILPVPIGAEYGSRQGPDMAVAGKYKDYYGTGNNVYIDILFNEPVFINDPGYLAYVRNMNHSERKSFAENQLAKKYPKDSLVLQHVLNNSGKTTAQQFGELKLKFRYKNSDGADKTGYASAVDRSLNNIDEIYRYDCSKKIKFQYTVQDGDEFQADDIYDLELAGGIITDNSFNMMPDERRKINFDTSSDNSINAVYRSYTQNFRVETTPPSLLDVNGKTPDGEISAGSDLDIYLKFSEPVYIVLPDGVGIHRAFVSLNSQYIDEYLEVSDIYGKPRAYYCGGNGTNILKFRYHVKHNKFDPLEIVGTGFMGTDTDDDNTGNTYGEVYVRDSAGNTAPLMRNSSLKLSDNKLYVADMIPPEFSAQIINADDGEDGFYLKVDASDTGSGLDYDSLLFGFGGLDVNTGKLRDNMKPLIPGKKYHSTELSGLFGVDIGKSDSFRVAASGKDRKNNYYFSPKSGYVWETVLSIDTLPPVLIRYSINKDVRSDKIGSFTLYIKKGDGVLVPAGWTSSVLDVEYKWITAGTNPDMEEWIAIERVYHQGMGTYRAEGQGPSYGIYGDADLYVRAVDEQGNESVFHIANALTYEEMRKALLINELCCMDISLGRNEGRLYTASVRVMNENGINVPFKGLWYCLTQEVNMPGFSDKTGAWKYMAGSKVRTCDYFGDDWDRINGYWYMHICAIDDNDKPICMATVPEALLFDFISPDISADEERQASGAFSSDGRLQKPYVFAVSGSEYNESVYTNEDFIEIEVYTSGNEFSYSTDGENWSGWLPLISKGTFSQMDSDRYYALHNNNGYNVYKAYVPLEQKEGNMTFHTRYRREGIQSEPVAVSVIRDVTPPTALVDYDPSYTTNSSVTASLSRISDNLCPGEAVKVLGKSSHTFHENGAYSFIIEDAAGNKAKVKADVRNIYIEPPDTSKPVIGITGTPDGAITNKAECTINVTDNSHVSIKYAWTTDGNWRNVQSNEWIKISNGGTVSQTGTTGAAVTWNLYVRASDSSGNTQVASRTYIIDSVAPVISIWPDGGENAAESVMTEITFDDVLLTKGTYIWSREETQPGDDDGWNDVPENGAVRLSGVEGMWRLYVKAADAAGNIGTFKSKPFNMIAGYTEPYVVYSGEEGGRIRAFLVSQHPITVDGPVYYDLERQGLGEAYTAAYDFNYSYGDGETHTITAQWDFPKMDEEILDMLNMFKGTVTISPYEAITSGEVEIIIEAPDDLEDNRNEYGDYDRGIVFWENEDGGLIKYLMENDRISVLTGCIYSLDEDYNIVIDEDISEAAPKLYNSELIGALVKAGQDICIYKAKLVTNANTDKNGLLYYHVDDGKYCVRVNHIADDGLAGNVTLIPSEPLGKSNDTLRCALPLLASASMNAMDNIILGANIILLSMNSRSDSDLTPPGGKITYAADNWKKGPVTANIELWDNSGGKVAITNNNGSGSYVFSENGQFVFEFHDEAGNCGRALAEVSTIDASIPMVKVLYSNKLPTKDAVKVTLVPGEGIRLKDGDIKPAFENGGYSFDAMDNGQWEFTFENEAGSTAEVTARVDNIDRIPPKLWVDYISDLYNNSVTAIVRSDEIIWPVKGEEQKHVFKENGQHAFTVQDAAGNEASITATVDYMQFLRLNRSNIDIKINYSTVKLTNKPVKISITSDEIFTVINNSGKTEKEVAKNGRYQFVVMDNLARLKIVEAEVTNIDTEAPVIKLGYPDEITLKPGDSIDLMNFTAVDNVDGDVTRNVAVEGGVNTNQAGIYEVAYRVGDACGNTAVKTLTVRIINDYSPRVFINGIEYESDPLMLDAKQLDISIKGFAGPVGLKWTKGFETAAFFKNNGIEATLGTIPITQKGWFTLYIYDNEKNSRLVHIVIDNAGGGNR